ncbi:hypothetical protein [Paraburkholderia sp. JHI869]|uniref:nSTAND1 domain-containing NTPase n=1 Tax=Paraburkholderia sp. JHI869 TaxID=3112959 RepID=UPI00317092D4
MDLKRLAEWLTTADGLGTKLVALVGVPAGVWAAVQTALVPFLPASAAKAIAGAAILFFFWILWRGFQRFARASRLENPDAFTLRPSGPETLVGRKTDLESLLRSVKQYRLVLMDGESGCGKSAIVTAGLVPSLKGSEGLLPCEIRDWGEDWVRGPLAATLEALFEALTPANRDQIDWIAVPDLAASEASLTDELNLRWKSIVDILKRRPLLIADQFDDYQLRHRKRFVDKDGNWLSPASVAYTNSFWRLISDGLREGRLHLIVVTRADTAVGLSCVRFLGEDRTATRTLARIGTEYLRPLFRNIAPEDLNPPAISNPGNGWEDLRDRLERDLQGEGAILMQQVRTVMLGLRQLPLLTPRYYRVAGGLHGVETLFVSRALSRAADAAGGGADGRHIARAVLSALVQPGGPNQPPKAKRAPLADLEQLADGKENHATAILLSLQKDEIVRPAEAVGGREAWQLDHDYLAGAVLSEARQADRWSVLLREGAARHDEAKGDLRRWWLTLLPFHSLVRVCWERFRGRLKFDNEVGYATVSMIKPVVVVVLLAFAGHWAYGWNRERILTAEANGIIDQFGSYGGRHAALVVWSAPEPLRARIYDLVKDDSGRLARALGNGWHKAHSGLDPARMKDVLTILGAHLVDARTSEAMLVEFAISYRELADRIGDGVNAKVEATALRGKLEHANSDVASEFARAYVPVAELLNDADAKTEAAALLSDLQRADPAKADAIASAYTAVAGRLGEADAKADITVLHSLLARANIAQGLSDAYAVTANRLNEANAKVEAVSLRTNLERSDSPTAGTVAFAYMAVAERMGAADAKVEAIGLHELLNQADYQTGVALASAYAAVGSRLSNADAKAEALVLFVQLEHAEGDIANNIETAYGAVADRLDDADAKTEAVALFARLERADSDTAAAIARAYAIVALRLGDAEAKTEATALLTRLVHEDSRNAFNFSVAYRAVARKLGEADAKVQANLLFARLSRPGSYLDEALATAYMTVAWGLSESDAKAEAAALRAHLNLSFNSRASDIAYAAAAARLSESDAKTEAISIHALLQQSNRGYFEEGFEQAYIAVIERMSYADVKVEAAYLAGQLEQADNFQIVHILPKVYGKAAAIVVEQSSGEERLSCIRQILILSGHPFVAPADLLGALKPAAGVDFGKNIGAAVHWFSEKYHIAPTQLRPPPLSARAS